MSPIFSRLASAGIINSTSGINIGRRRPGLALGLYNFTTFTFTNGTQTGASGPALANLLSAYNTTTNPWLNNTAYFNATSGIQLWTVPKTGSYTIDAYGAAGGNGSPGTGGGAGARILGTFSLTQGDKIRILVGQMGTSSGLVGGGGGGTFVMKETGTATTDIYAIAGGGGGGYYSSYNEGTQNGSSSTSALKGGGGAGGASLGGQPGTSGNGGTCYDRSGGGGGGLLGNGGSSTYGVAGSNGMGGYSFANGGQAYPGCTYSGGFGCGGAGDFSYWTGGGGGGGYNGGGGGYYYGNGGGGGSYNNGTSQTNTSGARSGAHGQVIITLVS
jgi:hypothetical protein